MIAHKTNLIVSPGSGHGLWGPSPNSYLASLTTAAIAAGTVWYVPFSVASDTIITTAWIFTTTGVVSSTADIGIYSVDATGAPSTRLAQATGLTTATSANMATGALSYTLSAGTNYQLALVCSGAVTLSGWATVANGSGVVSLMGAYEEASATLPATATPASFDDTFLVGSFGLSMSSSVPVTGL